MTTDNTTDTKIEIQDNHLKALFDEEPEIEKGTSSGEEETKPNNSEDAVENGAGTEDTKENGTDTDVTETSLEPTVAELQNDIATLRTLVQEQGSLISDIANQSGRLATSLSDSGHIDADALDSPVEGDEGFTPERLESLSTLAETMAVSPSYPEFEQICSEANFNRVVEGLANLALKEEGGTLTEHVQEVTEELWRLPNPYKFVYDIIIQHDPKYQTASESGTNDNPIGDKDKSKKTPASLSAVPGGGGTDTSGWTAAKIDSLDEEELSKVPKDVYELYLSNQLK